METVEQISWQGETLSYLIRASLSPTQTTFVTPPACAQQVGLIVCPTGGAIDRHIHHPVAHHPAARHSGGPPEVLIVRSGRCEVDLYSAARAHVATRTLEPGDVLVIVGGGHGFRMLEDTVLIEVKQGPYRGADDRERF